MKYYCRQCFYIYDEAKGEPDCEIPPRTQLKNTPSDYECPLCHNSKESYLTETEYFASKF